MSNEEEFDSIAAEQKQADSLLNNGVYIEIDRASVFRFIGPKKRRFIVRPLLPGTMAELSIEFLNLDYDEARLQADPIGESKRLMAHNLKRLARIAAIAFLNRKWKIRLFKHWLTDYLLWRIDGRRLVQLAMVINEQSRLADFTNSIRLFSIPKRITAPARIENQKAGANQPD